MTLSCHHNNTNGQINLSEGDFGNSVGDGESYDVVLRFTSIGNIEYIFNTKLKLYAGEVDHVELDKILIQHST